MPCVFFDRFGANAGVFVIVFLMKAKMKFKLIIFLVFLFSVGTVFAQNLMMEEVVVSGIRASSGDFYDIPAITIKKNADFLVQNIKLVNDSRSKDLRKKEIVKSINGLIKSSKRIKNIELSYGGDFLEPIKLNDDSLELVEDRDRVDTSFVKIYVKVAYEESLGAKAQINALSEFISNAKTVGRTEIDTLDDIGLSIVGPEQYRYEILRAIAAENKKIQVAIGGSCEMSIKGLEGRVEWERVSIGQLMLYIAHSVEVTCK